MTEVKATILKPALRLSVLAGLLVILAGTGAARAADAPKEEPTRADISKKIHALKDADLQKLIATHMYGIAKSDSYDEASRSNAAKIGLRGVTVDDVNIAGDTFTLVFVDANDLTQWKQYKTYLPAEVQKMVIVVKSDQQVYESLQRMTRYVAKKFEEEERKAFIAHRREFYSKYPGLPLRVAREAVQDSYKYNENNLIAPEAQRAYNTLAAVGELTNAMNFYMRFKKDL